MSDRSSRWYHRAYVGIQYLLPHHLLSTVAFRVTRIRWRPLKDLLIARFVRHLGVDMSEAVEPELAAYGSFNEFFTRSLRPGARPIADPDGTVACPADGTLSRQGTIENGRILQAKGHDFSLVELLAGDRDWAERFSGGAFATIYLSPRDYHRVHMPLSGTLREMFHVPGRLFSVNPITTKLVPRLFARNERVVCLFEADGGAMAVILVGAIFVGSIDTRWEGRITPTSRQGRSHRYEREAAVRLEKGEEMGRFNMGSTVVLLFPSGTVEWDPSLVPGDTLRMGQPIGSLVKGSHRPEG